MLLHKIIHLGEALIILLTISAQPFFGTMLSIVAILYYVAMFKVNVVNKYHNRSWRTYFFNLLNPKNKMP